MSKRYIYETTPRFSDTDAYGIVHHSSFFKWMEEARFDFANKTLAMTLDVMNDKRVQIVVLEANCKYLRPVHYGDRLAIETIMKLNKSAKFEFKYRINNVENGRLVAEAFTSHAYIRPDGRLILTHPEWLIDRIAAARNSNPQSVLME